MDLKTVSKDKLKKETKVFFRSQNWKNLLVFFIFVLLASAFWLLRYYQQKFDADFSIPIHYDNVPSEVVLRDFLPQKMNLKIQDNGTALLNYFFRKDWGAVHIDLKNISLEKNSYSIGRMDLNDIIQGQLLTTTRLISFYPENILVEYAPVEKKELPVRLNENITLAAGYVLVDSIQIKPSTVWVYGDKQTLDSLQIVRTEPLGKENIDKTLSLFLNLQVPKGTHLSTNSVDLTINIEACTEKSFEVPIVCYGLPENLHVRFFPSSVEIICQVALSKYPQFTAMDLGVGVEYEELIQDKSEMISLSLRKKPQWLINYRIVPERVEYLIEQKKNL